jgi:chemotaxis signal transduction protein
MVSLDKEIKSNEESFLVVKIDSIEFVVPIAQLDRVEEFNNEFLNDLTSEFCLGGYREQNELIPVLNLKKYLRCPDQRFDQTSQSRILFLRYSKKVNIFNSNIVGIGVNAIVGLYRGVLLERIRKTKSFVTKNRQCFRINSSVEINSKIYPILDLMKVFDLI